MITNPIFYSLDGIWRARLAPAQEAAVWPTRSLLKGGAHVAIGSDADEAVLKRIAQAAHGRYWKGKNEQEMVEIYREIARHY